MELNKDELRFMLKIVDISLQYGVPTIVNAIDNINKQVITEDDIENLTIDEEWENYFNEEY